MVSGRSLSWLLLACGHGPLSATGIASRQDLSVAYLEQLLHRLKKESLLTSIRGPKGGYVLAKSADPVTLADIVEVLDGTNGSSNGHRREHDTRRQAQRIAHMVWRCIHERVAESLNTVTLQDLCEEVKLSPAEPLNHRYVFHI